MDNTITNTNDIKLKYFGKKELSLVSRLFKRVLMIFSVECLN